jgi:hypothetical protein
MSPLYLAKGRLVESYLERTEESFLLPLKAQQNSHQKEIPRSNVAKLIHGWVATATEISGLLQIQLFCILKALQQAECKEFISRDSYDDVKKANKYIPRGSFWSQLWNVFCAHLAKKRLRKRNAHWGIRVRWENNCLVFSVSL